MSDHPNHSVAISVPTQMDSNGDGQNKNASLAATSPLRKIWSPLAYDVSETVKRIRNWNHDDDPNQRQVMQSLNNDEDPNQRHVMRSLIDLVSHLILCMIMTILLPISLPWKQIKRGRFILSSKWRRRFTLLSKWLLARSSKWLLAISCIAISLDPLFLYIPFIDEKNKCLGMNKTFRTTAIVLRSLTDLAFTFHIVALIHGLIVYVHPNPDTSPKDDRIVYVPPSPDRNTTKRAFKCIIRKRRLSKDIIIHFISILPIPQVTIIIVFFRMRGSAATVNFFLLLQFIVRGCQIYNFQRQVIMLRKWTSSAFYFLMYILAANVLGASWYFLSIQREISCWHQTNRNITECIATNYCEDTNSSTCVNITLLNKFCPINPSNATLYNFGIFLGALESGNVGPKSFWRKYFYTLWWGIRNLSNFGTNLETSNYVWEICFTIIISLSGLLLFIYLMGNVQTYILWESQRALKDQEKKFQKKIKDQEEKIEDKYQALNWWLSNHGIGEGTKTQVVEIIKQNQVVERSYGAVAVDLVFVFDAIKKDNAIKWAFWTRFCEDALKKVTILQHLPMDTLGELLVVLDPVCYLKDHYVVQKGELDDKMLIITKGIITCTYKTTASMIPNQKSRFEKGEVYGQELLSIDLNHLSDLTPQSIRDVQCETEVEAFALTAAKLNNIADFLERAHKSALQYRLHDRREAKKAYGELTTTKSKKMDRIEKGIIEWLSRNGVPDHLKTSVEKHIKANHHELEKNLDAEVDLKHLFSIGLSEDIEYSIKKHLCMSTLSKKVPVLDWVDDDVLQRICMSLEPVIFQKNDDVFKPGDQIDQMLIIVAGEIISTERTIFRGYGPVEKPNVETINKGDFLGEKVLMSAFPDPYISNYRPAISNEYVSCCTKVEAFALTKESVKKVVTYYTEGTHKSEQVENGRDGVANTKGASTSTTTIEQRLDHLIQLQSDITNMLQQQGRRLDEMAAFLA